MNETPSQVYAVQVHEQLLTLMVRMVGDHPEFAARVRDAVRSPSLPWCGDGRHTSR